jgi:hypothetical protein
MVINDRHPIIIADLNNMRERERNRNADFFKWHLLPCTYSERFPSGEFNYDGTWLAVNMSGKKYRFLPKSNQKINEFEISSEEKDNNDDIFYIAIAFHRNNITAALLRNDGAVEFWNYKKKLLLGVSRNETDAKMLWKDRNCRDQLLCFSPDCESVIVSVGSKISLRKTPRPAICVKDTGMHCFALFCALKNSSVEISDDIIWNIIDNFLWCSELVHEKKMDKIIAKYRSEMAACALANQEEISEEEIVSDQEKNDFCECTLQIKKTYVKAMAVVLVGIAALYTFI